MALFGGIGSFLKQNVFAYALGTATGGALKPFVQELENEAWHANPLKPVTYGLLAEGVATGKVDEGWAAEWAEAQGISPDAFRKLTRMMTDLPSVELAFTLWRRELTGPTGFDEMAKAQGLDETWIEVLHGLKDGVLSPAEVANAVQQGHLPNPEILPALDATVTPAPGATAPLTPDGQPRDDVPLTLINLDPIKQAAGHGTTLEQLKVLANLAGLPPGPEALLTMWNRGLITEEAVNAGIREGHMKTKWTGPFKRMRWAVLSAQEAASARLRTWISAEESYAIGALTGHTKEQMDLMFLNRGRPASPTQMWTAFFRKAVGPRGVPVEYEDHAKAIAISDIRPEYAEQLWAIKNAYPSLFQLGRLVSSGAITPDLAETWARYNRYDTDVTGPLLVYWKSIYNPGGANGVHLKNLTVTELRAEYEGGFLAAPDLLAALVKLGYSDAEATVLQHLGDAARVKTYRDKVLEALHKAYVGHAIDETVAGATMTAERVSGEAQAELLALWKLERDFTRHTLTAAQIKRAYKRNLIDQATATAELVDRGYSAADAATYLAS